MRLFLLFFFMLWINNIFGQKQVTFRGNKIDMSPSTNAEVFDPVSGKMETKIISATPERINGETIYDIHDLTKSPAYANSTGEPVNMSAMIFDSVKEFIQKLYDGEYILQITNPVIDQNGYLAYFEFSGIKKLVPHIVSTIEKIGESVNGITKPTTKFTRIEKTPTDKNIPFAIKNVINATTKYLLDHAPKMNPGEVNGVKVNCKEELFNSSSFIIVKNHNAVFYAQ